MSPAAAQTVRDNLQDRRQRLVHLTEIVEPASDLVRLLGEVDSALDRLDGTDFDECVFCQEQMVEEIERHPMGRYCLCELDAAQIRALEQDLEMAWSIQAGLLPAHDLRSGDWLSHYRYLPAGPVSGDVVDLVCDGRGALHFLLGDVAGKGVSAALLMAHLAATYRALIRDGLPLDALMVRINAELTRRTDPGRHATLVVGVARPNGEIDLVNAGHVPPLVVGAAGTEAIGATGVPAGLFPDSSYAVERRRLNPGESLVLYTDGLVESTDSGDNEFGIDGLRAVASRWSALDAPGLAAAALSAVTAHRGGSARTDDETLLVIRRDGNQYAAA